MSSQSEKEFLSAVVLEKSLPFKDGKIEMGGENEIQLLIKFYLENKKIEVKTRILRIEYGPPIKRSKEQISGLKGLPKIVVFKI